MIYFKQLKNTTGVLIVRYIMCYTFKSIFSSFLKKKKEIVASLGKINEAIFLR